MLSAQIEADYTAYQEDRFSDVSLAARWAPRREKGKFALVTRRFVETIHATRRYNGTSMRDVRKMLSLLNQSLNTPQIDMCQNTWRCLNFNSMTSYTLLKHKKAFLNLNKQGEQRSTKEDRVKCANHYTEWLHSKGKKMNVGTIYPYEFVRDLLNTSPLCENETKYYNDAWKAQTETQFKTISQGSNGTPGGSMIPMIDVSGSMTVDKSLPLYNAIALGIRLSELNLGAFHNMALTFESTPKWAYYRDDQSFCEKVKGTCSLGWGGSTNFECALQMILQKIIETNLSPLAVKHTAIVVFSDM